MPFVPITDPADARLEEYRSVPDADLLERRGVFVAEGRLVVTRLLTGGRFGTRSVLVTETARAALAAEFDARHEVPVFVAPQWMLNAITGFNVHRGCLAIGERPPAAAWQQVLSAATTSAAATEGTMAVSPGDSRDSTIVVIERLANADNVGAIFRNAAAFGADAVLLDPASADPLYRKAIRTSMAAALRVPFARMEPWPGALGELRALGYRLIGMTSGAGATVADVIARDRPANAGSHSGVTASARGASGSSRKIALLLGHEGDGLTAAALAACDVHARIPIVATVDSLNVATACAIALYERERA